MNKNLVNEKFHTIFANRSYVPSGGTRGLKPRSLWFEPTHKIPVKGKKYIVQQFINASKRITLFFKVYTTKFLPFKYFLPLNLISTAYTTFFKPLVGYKGFFKRLTTVLTTKPSNVWVLVAACCLITLFSVNSMYVSISLISALSTLSDWYICVLSEYFFTFFFIAAIYVLLFPKHTVSMNVVEFFNGLQREPGLVVVILAMLCCKTLIFSIVWLNLFMFLLHNIKHAFILARAYYGDNIVILEKTYVSTINYDLPLSRVFYLNFVQYYDMLSFLFFYRLVNKKNKIDILVLVANRLINLVLGFPLWIALAVVRYLIYIIYTLRITNIRNKTHPVSVLIYHMKTHTKDYLVNKNTSLLFEVRNRRIFVCSKRIWTNSLVHEFTTRYVYTKWINHNKDIHSMRETFQHCKHLFHPFSTNRFETLLCTPEAYIIGHTDTTSNRVRLSDKLLLDTRLKYTINGDKKQYCIETVYEARELEFISLNELQRVRAVAPSTLRLQTLLATIYNEQIASTIFKNEKTILLQQGLGVKKIIMYEDIKKTLNAGQRHYIEEVVPEEQIEFENIWLRFVQDKDIQGDDRVKFRAESFDFLNKVHTEGIELETLQDIIIKGSGYMGKIEYHNTKAFFSDNLFDAK